MSQSILPKLYQYAVCPFCCKVKAILAYKNIPHETVEVHPLNKKEIKFSKNYRKVPIFMDVTGNQVNESTSIMKYIDEKYQERPVFEKSGESKSREEKWLDWADKTLVRALPPVIYRNIPDAIKAFDYITQEGKFSWFEQRTIKYSGALVMTLVAKKTAKSQGIFHPQQHLENCFKTWGEAFKGQKFLGGTKPNGADLAVYGILKSIEGMPAFQLVENHPQVFEWYQAVEETTTAVAA